MIANDEHYHVAEANMVAGVEARVWESHYWLQLPVQTRIKNNSIPTTLDA